MWRPGGYRSGADGHERHTEQVRAPGRPRDTEVEERILGTALELLNTLGYNGMSIEAVAAHAGVGKTTVYRRWSSKGRLVAAVVAWLARFPEGHGGDVGTDLRAYVDYAADLLRAPATRNIMAGLAADAAADDGVAAAYDEQCATPKREAVSAILEHALRRGEVAPGADPALVTDLLIGAVLWRAVFTRRPLDDTYVAGLAAHVAAGLPRPGAPPRRQAAGQVAEGAETSP